MTPPVRVVIADDHPMFRYGLRAVLAAVDRGRGGRRGRRRRANWSRLSSTPRPDVVLTDLAMPGLDGATAAAADPRYGSPAPACSC